MLIADNSIVSTVLPRLLDAVCNSESPMRDKVAFYNEEYDESQDT